MLTIEKNLILYRKFALMKQMNMSKQNNLLKRQDFVGEEHLNVFLLGNKIKNERSKRKILIRLAHRPLICSINWVIRLSMQKERR